MQVLEKGKKHVAAWGGYQVVIDSRDLAVRGSVALAILNTSIPGASSLPEIDMIIYAKGTETMEEAVEAAAAWLERHGCLAFVDGRPRSLADFLRFSPAEVS